MINLEDINTEKQVRGALRKKINLIRDKIKGAEKDGIGISDKEKKLMASSYGDFKAWLYAKNINFEINFKRYDGKVKRYIPEKFWEEFKIDAKKYKDIFKN